MDEYISRMDREHSWGDELELSILSKLYNCKFIIHANNRPDITVLNYSGLICVRLIIAQEKIMI